VTPAGTPSSARGDEVPEQPVVDVAGLVRDFREVRALDGVDLTVGAGEVVGLLGHNGAGKTTVLRHLTGLLDPTAGTVRVFAVDPVHAGGEVRRRIGVLPASAGVDGVLSGWANLAVVGELWELDPPVARERAARLLDELGLSDDADKRAETYSTGMRQRLALARALLHDPELLLLDEPTTALDPMAARQVRRTIARLSREEGRTVLLCTHDLAEAETLCDRVVVLERGRVLAQGAPRELISQLGIDALLLDIDDPDVARTRMLLEDRGLVVTEDLEGLRVAGIGQDVVPELLADLVHDGVRVRGAWSESASLADVYHRLHE
jgi:ABC-type multidrug transport system ATPase subunit